MKKILVLFFATCLATPVLKAQTAAETLEWLKAKLPPMGLKSEYGNAIEFTDYSCKLPSEMRGQEVSTMDIMEYKDIANIVYKYQPETNEKFESHQIVFSGNFKKYNSWIYDKSTFSYTNSTYFPISPSFSKSEVEKIIKAFKNLATLKGAKLVKDDLF